MLLVLLLLLLLLVLLLVLLLLLETEGTRKGRAKTGSDAANAPAAATATLLTETLDLAVAALELLAALDDPDGVGGADLDAAGERRDEDAARDAAERAVARGELDAFCGRAVPLFELSAADHDTVHEAFVEAFRAVEDAGRDDDDDDDDHADAGAAASAFANGETADLSGAVTASPARAQKREREERERRRAERRERRNKNKTAEQLQEEERERLERALPAGDTCRVLPGEELHEALLPKLRGEDEKDGCCAPCACVIC